MADPLLAHYLEVWARSADSWASLWQVDFGAPQPAQAMASVELFCAEVLPQLSTDSTVRDVVGV